MNFTIRNKILAMVEDRARYLENLICEYPHFLEDWTKRTSEEFEKEAKEFAGDDMDVFHDTLISNLSAFDENEFREDMFYKAMLIMVYSYYEGIVEFLVKKHKLDDYVEQLCKITGVELSKEARDAKNRIRSDVRVLRNYLVHHNMEGEAETKDKDNQPNNKLKKIIDEWPELNYENGKLTISGTSFLLDVLHKEELLLKELCEMLGYKHKKIQTS